MTARSPRDERIEAPKNREDLRLLIAEAIYPNAFKGGAMAEQIRLAFLETDRTLSAIEQHCWIAPRYPTREMWAASGDVIVSGKLSSPKTGPKKHHDKITAEVFTACRDHSPYAAEKKDATTATEKESA